jgi:hypothetical protein
MNKITMLVNEIKQIEELEIQHSSLLIVYSADYFIANQDYLDKISDEDIEKNGRVQIRLIDFSHFVRVPKNHTHAHNGIKSFDQSEHFKNLIKSVMNFFCILESLLV